MLAFERAGVGGADLLDDLGDAVRAEEGRALGALDLADLFGDRGALVQQFEQLPVEPVDLVAQSEQRLGGNRLSHGGPRNLAGRPPAPARLAAAWRCRWRHACRRPTCGP